VTVVDTTPTVSELHALMQADFNRLMERAQDVADELAALFGARGGHVTIGIEDIDPDLFHALPHETKRGGWFCWKQIAKGKSISRIDVDCAHDEACPDRPVTKEAQP
jgi:diadenosine tetraphosphate (Ap4A) HIT family hydrolase